MCQTAYRLAALIERLRNDQHTHTLPVLVHDGDVPGAGFHASIDLGHIGTAPARLWQQDKPDARPGLALAGQLLSEAEAHELGLALMRAGDTLRRQAVRA